MDGDRVIAKILKAEGVEWISCFPHQPLIDAVTHEGIRPILTRQERAGVNMADGFSRIKNGRSIGVFTMQEGPGAENAFAGVAQAYADSVPVLMLPGGIARFKRGVHPNFEAASNYVGVTKWAANINLVSRIPELMGHAFSQLKHGRPGPVLIEMPSDVGSETYPHDHLDYEPVVRRLSAGDSDDVRELVSALLKASNPMIHAGQGVMYAEATDELVEFAELTHIPGRHDACRQERLPGRPPAFPRVRPQIPRRVWPATSWPRQTLYSAWPRASRCPTSPRRLRRVRLRRR